MKDQHPQEGRIYWLLRGIAKTFNIDEGYLIATVEEVFPALKDPEKCANCGASMMAYVFEFDVLDALMLLAMGKSVREQGQLFGADFTTANQVRVQSLDATYAMKSRTTQMAKLGLIAKLLNGKGDHVPGMWVITTRGWAALRGAQVPRRVMVWRGKIEERTDEKITLSQALASHREKVERVIARRKAPKSDYRKIADTYNVQDWVNFGGVRQGSLL